MNTSTVRPDVTQRDEAPYWAAALVLAMRRKDGPRVALARRNLARLGFSIHIGKAVRP